MPNRKPFSRDEFPDLTKAISEIVAPKPKKTEGKKGDKPDKWGGKEPYVKNDRNPHTTPHKRIDEACWKGYTAKGTKRKGDRMVPNCVKEEEVVGEGFAADERKAARSARVRKWMGRLKKANAADLKEYPGKKGEAAHKRLHKTIGGMVGEEALTAAEIAKRLEPSRAAQRPKIRAAMKAKLKAKHKGESGNGDERMGRNTQRYKSGPAQGWTGD